MIELRRVLCEESWTINGIAPIELLIIIIFFIVITFSLGFLLSIKLVFQGFYKVKKKRKIFNACNQGFKGRTPSLANQQNHFNMYL